MLRIQAEYRADVDGLRAVAIIPVVAFHVGLPFFGGGFVGVDVFFVISGFLITGLLCNQLDRNGHIAFLDFYARRARRLFPALAVVCLATLLIGVWLLLPFGEQQELAWTAIATSLFSSNFYFWAHSGYFDGPAEQNPLLNMWTLSVEEQFYWVWPFLLVVIWRLADFCKASARQQTGLLVATLVVVLVVSLASSVFLTNHSQPTAFYMMPVRAWEFALGGIVARMPLPRWNGRAIQGYAISALGLVGLVMIAWAVATYSRTTPFPGSAAMLPALGAALVIYSSGSATRSPIRKLLAMRGTVAVGLVSYSWYLWHWPLIAMARAYDYGLHDLARDSSLAVVALGLAFLTYRFIENPLRRARSGVFSSTRGALIAGLCLLLLIALSAAGLGVWSKLAARSYGNGATIYAAMRDHQIMAPECSSELEGVFRGTLLPVEKCTFGASQIRVLVWGDSYADQYGPLLERLGRKYSLGFIQRLLGGCPPTLGIVPLRFGIPHPNCAEFNNQVQSELSSYRSMGMDSVILSANWLAQDPLVSSASKSAEDPVARFEFGLGLTLDALQSHGFKVLLIAPSPEFPLPVPFCLARRSADECKVSRIDFERRRTRVMDVIRKVIIGRSNVKMFDPVQSLCNDDYCPPIVNGVIAYRDTGHIATRALAAFDENLSPLMSWLAHQEN